jgi:hypothetical protein
LKWRRVLGFMRALLAEVELGKAKIGKQLQVVGVGVVGVIGVRSSSYYSNSNLYIVGVEWSFGLRRKWSKKWSFDLGVARKIGSTQIPVAGKLRFEEMMFFSLFPEFIEGAVRHTGFFLDESFDLLGLS